MSLPSAWVDRLFERLIVTYGQRFLGLYSGLDLDVVKANWAHELRGLAQSPNAIRHALAHLPTGEPPNVLQFRDLCRMAPTQAQLAIGSAVSKPDPSVMQAIAQGFTGGASHDPLAWARRLREREERGEPLSLFQARSWRIALGEPTQELDA